jgi:hypothetical protein
MLYNSKYHQAAESPGSRVTKNVMNFSRITYISPLRKQIMVRISPSYILRTISQPLCDLLTIVQSHTGICHVSIKTTLGPLYS